MTREPVSEPEYWRVHRLPLVAFIVLTPVVLLLGFAWYPELGVPHKDAATVAAFQAANPVALDRSLSSRPTRSRC